MDREMTHTDDIYVMLGEMRGKLSEVAHGMTEASRKIDTLTREVVEIKGVFPMITAIEVRLTTIEGKVATLTTDKDRRAGALSLGEWVIRVVPWAVGAAAFAIVAKLVGIVP